MTLSASDHGPYVEFFEPGTESSVEFGMSHTQLHLTCHYPRIGLSAAVRVEGYPDGLHFYDDEGRLLFSVRGRRFPPSKRGGR